MSWLWPARIVAVKRDLPVASVTSTQQVPLACNVSRNGLRTVTLAPSLVRATRGVADAGFVVGGVVVVGANDEGGVDPLDRTGAAATRAGPCPPVPTVVTTTIANTTTVSALAATYAWVGTDLSCARARSARATMRSATAGCTRRGP